MFGHFQGFIVRGQQSNHRRGREIGEVHIVLAKGDSKCFVACNRSAARMKDDVSWKRGEGGQRSRNEQQLNYYLMLKRLERAVTAG